MDKRGTQVRDWANADSFQLSNCSVQIAQTTRDFDGRTLSVSEEWTLYAQPNADLLEGDRVEWRGLTFEVNGSLMPWTSPTGRVSHVVARLSEWRG